MFDFVSTSQISQVFVFPSNTNYPYHLVKKYFKLQENPFNTYMRSVG